MLFQGLKRECNGGNDSGTDLCSDKATGAVCRHFFFDECWFKHVNILIFLNECWLECLLTHDFKRFVFIYRWLDANQLAGTIPAQISALVNLEVL